MTASPLEPLRALFGDQLQELSGSVVSGEVPITTAVINQLIARKLATANVPIVAAEVETRPAETFTVHLRPKGPIPLLKVDVAIERQPQLPGDPRIGLRWTLRGAGLLTAFAAPVIGFFKALPPGISMDRDFVWVDLHTLLRSRGLGEMVPFLTGIRVLTREARFVVQFELRR